MKIKSMIISAVLALTISTLIFNCKKETPKVAPTVSILPVSNITGFSAACKAEITSGNDPVTESGICWSLSYPSNTTSCSNNATSNIEGTDSLKIAITGLTPATTYYIRAYATNSAGTTFSSPVTFKTSAVNLPTLTTWLSGATSTAATGGGNITDDGGSEITARGVCWSTNTNPTTANNKTTDGTGTGRFTSTILGLDFAVVYYFRAYATNSVGTAYGNWVTNNMTGFPVITTLPVSSITSTAATSGGNITSDGRYSEDSNSSGSPVTARGVCWGTTQNLTITNSKTTDGTGIGSFTSNLTGLTPNTSYYVRAYATNSIGTNYGRVAGFFTSQLNCESCEIVQIKYGTSFNNCSGYCKKELTLSPGATIYTKQGILGTPAPVTCTGVLDNNTWNAVKTGMNIPSFFKLPLVIGCPDCADGGDGWIEMTLTNGEIHKVKFEYNNVPAGLTDYNTLLKNLLVNAGNNCP